MTNEAKSATQGFQFVAGSLALDFVNTVGNRLATPRDYFRTGADLNRWAQLAGLWDGGSSLSLPPKRLAAIRSVREELYAVFRGPACGVSLSKPALARLDARLAQVGKKRRLKCVGGTVRWEWETSSRDPDRILGPILVDATELLVSNAVIKLRQCADDACGWLFLDRSQGGRRRWCSMADCGNRAKARRFYRQDHGR